MYIGTAERIKSRLRSHNKRLVLRENGVNHVTWMELPTLSRTERYRVERFLIDQHQPILNKQTGSKRINGRVRNFLRAASAKAAKARREKIPSTRRSEIAAKAAAARWNTSPPAPTKAA